MLPVWLASMVVNQAEIPKVVPWAGSVQCAVITSFVESMVTSGTDGRWIVSHLKSGRHVSSTGVGAEWLVCGEFWGKCWRASRNDVAPKSLIIFEIGSYGYFGCLAIEWVWWCWDGSSVFLCHCPCPYWTHHSQTDRYIWVLPIAGKWQTTWWTLDTEATLSSVWHNSFYCLHRRQILKSWCEDAQDSQYCSHLLCDIPYFFFPCFHSIFFPHSASFSVSEFFAFPFCFPCFWLSVLF